MKILSFLLLLSLAFLYSCSESDKDVETDAEGKVDKKQEQKEVNNEKEGSQEESHQGDVSSCKETQLTFMGEGLNQESFEVVSSKVTLTTMQSNGKEYEALFVVLANYGNGGRIIDKPQDEGDLMLTYSFSVPTGEKIAAQSYSAESEGFGASYHFSGNFETSSDNYMFNMPEGEGVITYLGEDKVCGNISLIDNEGKTEVKGDFSVNR